MTTLNAEVHREGRLVKWVTLEMCAESIHIDPDGASVLAQSITLERDGVRTHYLITGGTSIRCP